MVNPTAQFLDEKWGNPRDGISFRSSLVALRKHAQKQGVKFNTKDAEEWLTTQNTHTLHRQVIKKFPRRKVLTRGIGYVLAIDLLDVSSLSKWNKGTKFILTAVCCFSRRGFARKLLNKSGQTVTDALESIIKEFPVTKCWSDNGREFKNKIMTDMLKKYGILLYQTKNELKSCFVEIFNRTLRRRISKFMTWNRTNSFIEHLDNIIHGYNNSYHRSINMTPFQVCPENQAQLWSYLYEREPIKQTKTLYRIGQYVRLAKLRNTFEKATSNPGYTSEIFKITKVNCRPETPVTYSLSDLLKEEIEGEFYSREIAPVQFSESELVIYKVYKTRKRGGIKEHQISYLGYPNDYRKWIPSSELKRLQ